MPTQSPYTVAERKAWTKPGCSNVAAHCLPAGEGWTLTVTGYRVIRPDGSTYRPSYAAHSTREAAEAEAGRLNNAAWLERETARYQAAGL